MATNLKHLHLRKRIRKKVKVQSAEMEEKILPYHLLLLPPTPSLLRSVSDLF